MGEHINFHIAIWHYMFTVGLLDLSVHNNRHIWTIELHVVEIRTLSDCIIIQSLANTKRIIRLVRGGLRAPIAYGSGRVKGLPHTVK